MCKPEAVNDSGGSWAAKDEAEMKHSDQEIKQPSKQQEPIYSVASKMPVISWKKSMITSQRAETHMEPVASHSDHHWLQAPPQACDDDTSLPDSLNHFYSLFEMQNDTPAQKLPTPPNDQALSRHKEYPI